MNKDVTIVIIKKYANRRLYNMSSSCYIVYSDLIQMIKDGIKVKIIDAQTEEDITYTTILHALAENNFSQSINRSQNDKEKNTQSVVIQEIARILLNTSGKWIFDYLEILNQYVDDIGEIYKESERIATKDPIASFIYMQKIQAHNNVLIQKIMALTKHHFT